VRLSRYGAVETQIFQSPHEHQCSPAIRRFINRVGAKVFLLDFNVGGLYRLTKRIERVVKFAAPLIRGEKVPQ
jgi:hypothetical protein